MDIEKMRAFIIRFVFYCIVFGLGFVALRYALPFLMPFIMAYFFAFLLKPVIRWVEKKTHMRRRTASVLVLIGFYIILIGLMVGVGSRFVVLIRDGILALPAAYENSIAPALDLMQQRLEEWIMVMNPNLTAIVDTLGNNLSSSLSSLVGAVSSGLVSVATNAAGRVPDIVVKVFITIIASFYFVADYDMITHFLLRQLSDKRRELILKIKNKSAKILRCLGRAYAMLMGITFVEVWVGLSLLGVEYAFVIALITAVVDIFPILGTGTILIPWAIVELVLGHVPMGVGLLILYALITVVRQTLEPRVVGRQIGLYPLVTLACMFVGTYLFGVLGLFGLPIIVTVIVELNKSGDVHIFK